jgi:uncharacterized membrane protein YfhO
VIERAFVPQNVTVGTEDAETLRQMSGHRDFRERAWILASVAPYESDNGPGRVVTRRIRNGYELAADMERDGWVVVSESAWGGWRAYVDGRRVQMQLANAAFLSIYVPGGKHTVKLLYWPRSFVIGRAISFLTLAGIIVFAIVRKLRSRRAERQQKTIG